MRSELYAAQRQFAADGISQATKATRRSQLRRYKKFCTRFKFKPFPCTAEIACVYATSLSPSLKPCSVRNYLSAVWYKQKMLGYIDYSEDFVLKQTLNGIERSYDASEDNTRYPLSALELLEMWKLLDVSVTGDKSFWVAVILCFRGLVRKCHVTNSIHMLRVKDITVHPAYLKIIIRSSKTDQYGHAPFDIYLHRMPGSPFCPVDLILELLQGSSNEDSLLYTYLGRLRIPISYGFMNSKLKRLAALLHLPVSRVSTHSLRHGGTTMLRDLGLPVDLIMRKGNWKSRAVYRYLHQSEHEMLRLDQEPCTYLDGLMS